MIIEVNNLSKVIGSRTILDRLSFTVRPGEILGLLGPNGAGKTTTMKILTGFWQASGGQVTIDGYDLPKRLLFLKKHIGYLPENVPLYDDMKVYEYLKFVAELREISPEKIIIRLKEVVASCGLQQVIGQSIGELSKGYRQRLGLAQAIMHDPDILILDEPTTGLDPNQIVEIRELIKTIGQQKTVIFSTHILAEASATCDRVLIINQGRLVAEGAPSELISRWGQSYLLLRVRGPQEAVAAALRSLPGAGSVEIIDQIDDLATYHWPCLAEGLDQRELLARTIITNNWGLLELRQATANLEEIFRQLTQ